MMNRFLAYVAAFFVLFAATATHSQNAVRPVATYRGDSYAHISTNATTTPSGAKVLSAICVNTKGATANTATIYDNTAASGTVVGVLDTTAATGCYNYGVKLGVGLTIVTASGAAADLTVVYR